MNKIQHSDKQTGFKCGIEIHQQLEGKKLFCSCPCEIIKGKPDFVVKRYLRASAGETGEVDKAAAFEQNKKKHYLYHCFRKSTCLVELDEEPPHPVNADALRTCLSICKLLNAKVEKAVQFMRKVVVDGSNVSGFQRTALVGRNGYIELDSGKRISISVVCLEEEACQPIDKMKTHDVYNLSRQGIPLIEIATGPDISSPEEAKQAAAKIGMILRSVQGIKRGIGTIRQDVNVSIKGGARVEIKGFQEYKSIPRVIEYEVKRQLSIIKSGKTLLSEVRKATPELKTEFMRPMPGAARMYPETDIPLVSISMEGINVGLTLEQKEQALVSEYKLRPELAKEILKKGVDMKTLAMQFGNTPAAFIAETIINAPKEIKSRYKREIDVLEHLDVLKKLDKGEIPRSAVFEILSEIAHGKKPDYSMYGGISQDDLDVVVKQCIAEDPKAPVGAIMGKAMAKLRGRAEGKQVMDALNRLKKAG